MSRQNFTDTGSMISRCGSISGDAYVSLRSRCSFPAGGASRKVDKLAQHLREYHSKNCGQQESLGGEKSNPCGFGRRINSCFHQYRFVVAMLTGMAAGIMMFHRYSMSIAILAMVNRTHLYLEENPNKTVQNFLDEGNSPGGEFLWNNEIMAIILGWYMFSYTLPQTFAAKWFTVLGCRYAMPLSLAVCAISLLLTPTAAYMGWKWVVACRLINGVGAAGVVPGLIQMIENWVRYDEISSGLTIAEFLIAIMTAICPLISGHLAHIHWSMAFYVTGCSTIVFCVVWLLLITDKPHLNWLVSQRELDHLYECDALPAESVIEDCCKEKCGPPTNDLKSGSTAAAATTTTNDPDLSYKPDSWLQILKLHHFYAYMAVWIINCSCFACFNFIVPAYMAQFLKFSISENGYYLFIMQAGLIVGTLWPQKFMELLLRWNLTITTARILAQALCSVVMAVTWIYVGIYHQYQLPLFFLNRCFVATDMITTGSMMSNFAKGGLSSLVFAMVNTVGNLSVTGSSPFCGWLLDYTGSSEFGWRIIFFILAGAQILILIIFSFVDSEPVTFRNKNKAKKSPEEGDIAPVFAIESLPKKATPKI